MNNKFSKQQTKLKVRKRTEKKGFIIGLWKKRNQMRRRWDWKNSQSSMKQSHWNQVLPMAYNIDTMLLTCENCIYHNINMEHILSKKLENVVGKVRGKSG